MRQRVFMCFVVGFAIAVLFAMAVALTCVVRFGFTAGGKFAMRAVPMMFLAVVTDPWLIPAFVIACLFLWSFPWESRGTPPVDTTHRRGRKMSSYEEARSQTLAELARRGHSATGSPPAPDHKPRHPRRP
jgi:hypothetical protein